MEEWEEYDGEYQQIRVKITPSQIKLLRHHVQQGLYTTDILVTDTDQLVNWRFLDWEEIEQPKESYTGDRSRPPAQKRYYATGRGEEWLKWYDKQPKS